MTSLKTKAIKGAIWTVIGYGGSQFLRLISNLILTRLLVPELFGLMALANTFIVGLNLFSDVGIKPSIVRSPRGEEPKFLNTAWTIQVIRGCLLWVGCLIIAFPVSRFYEEPKLLWLIPIIGFNTCFIASFESTSFAILNRNLEVGKQTLIEITTQIITLTVMIIWAYFQPTIWALVIGNFISQLVSLYWSFKISSIPHRLTWDKEAVKELISFGRWIFVATAINFLASQSDRLIIGKFFPLEMLGIYTIAFTFADIPRKIITQISSKILFPVFSQKILLPREELRKKILSKRKLLLILSAFLVATLYSFGDIIIDVLYDQRYQDAGWMLPILTLGLWPLILNLTIGKVLFSIGQPQYASLGSFMKFMYMIILLPLVLTQLDLWWGILVIGFNDIAKYIATSYGLWNEGFSCFKQDAIMTLILITFIACLAGLRNFFIS